MNEGYVTPAMRKWLAHLAAGRPIFWSPAGDTRTEVPGEAPTRAMLNRLQGRAFIKWLSASGTVEITERGYLALKASEVDGPMLEHLRRACNRVPIPYRAQGARGKLYGLGLIDDRGIATFLGARVVALIDEAPQ